MEKVINSLKALKDINQAYGLDIDSITCLETEISQAKICIPIIGKFSSGKSALVNTILGYSKKLLREDITPETAVPTEVVYTNSDEMVIIINNEGEEEQIPLAEYKTFEADADTVKNVRLKLRNSFLSTVPDVVLVDMPGFESGFEVHNKAIDNYLPNSLAYIITFPADDMIVRSSVGNILKELCLHDMPLCIVITKYDKGNDDFNETFAAMQESLKRYVGDRELTYCKTSSFFGDGEEVESFLASIQVKSQEILSNKYKKLVLPLLENTQNYFVTTLNNSQLSESELLEKEEKINKQLVTLKSKFSKEKENFDLELSECITEIKGDIKIALEAEESTLIAMAINNQDIKEHLNTVIRNAVTISIKNRFIPKVEKYLKHISKVINSEAIDNISVSFTCNTNYTGKSITSNIVAIVAGLILGGPIGAILAGVFMKLYSNRKREQVKEQIRQKLRCEVYPDVLRNVEHGIEKSITEQINLINTSVEEELAEQQRILDKAMTDLKQQIDDEKAKKENLALDIKKDMERIEGLKDALR